MIPEVPSGTSMEAQASVHKGKAEAKDKGPLRLVLDTSGWSEEEREAVWNDAERWPSPHDRGVVKLYVRTRQVYHIPERLCDFLMNSSAEKLNEETWRMSEKAYLASVARRNGLGRREDDRVEDSPRLLSQQEMVGLITSIYVNMRRLDLIVADEALDLALDLARALAPR